MPNRDGTGPTGSRSGRMGGPKSAGPVGSCVCPSCGAKVAHRRAEPCYSLTCPHCGAKLTRA